VALCRDAGVRTVMVTGDHMLTGHAIARDLGIAGEGSTAMEGAELANMSDEDFDRALADVAVFGRVAPEHKLRIVERFQNQGEVVAMTGDGVNDAPALAKADIGVAMGITGTEVAKEASAMVITDDNFATIVSAIQQGRIIFNNIRKAVYYLFSTSAGEILTLFTALVAGLPLPLRAVQILWINLVTDGALTVNLVMEKAEGDEMKRRPLRRNAAMVPRAMLRRMLLLVPVMGFGTVAMFAWALQSGRSRGARPDDDLHAALRLPMVQRTQRALLPALGFHARHLEQSLRDGRPNGGHRPANPGRAPAALAGTFPGGWCGCRRSWSICWRGVIGPALGWVEMSPALELISETGIALLLFLVGLELSFAKSAMWARWRWRRGSGRWCSPRRAVILVRLLGFR
jgi:soluble P-type ATPase